MAINAAQMKRAFFSRGRGKILWRDTVGPIAVLLGVGICEQLINAYPGCPEPAPLILVAVAVAGFLAELNSAVLSSMIAVAYALTMVQQRHPTELAGLPFGIEAMFLAVAAPLLAIMGSLMRSSANRNAETLRKHLANTPLGVIELTEEYEVRLWEGSAEAIFGISAKDAVGNNLFELPTVFFQHDDAQEVRNLLTRLQVGSNKKAVHQTQRLTQDGSSGHSRWFWSSTLDTSGGPAGFLVLVEDITERVVAEQALLKSKAEIIERLVRAAELRDSETGDHIIRMARYAEQLAIALGWPQADTALLRAAAPMHDIGKIGIPDNVLQKPGELTSEEYELMKTHTVIGGNILAGSSSELVQMAESIAWTHHERWDGKGYPRGLKGFEIPVAGRICAVCDVFDALTSPRHYKLAWTFEEASTELKRLAGTHLEPKLVELFISILPSIRAIRDEYGIPDEPDALAA